MISGSTLKIGWANRLTTNAPLLAPPTKEKLRKGVEWLIFFEFFGNVLLMSRDQWDLIVLGVGSKITIFSTGPWSWNCGILRVQQIHIPQCAFIAPLEPSKRICHMWCKPWKNAPTTKSCKCWDIFSFEWCYLWSSSSLGSNIPLLWSGAGTTTCLEPWWMDAAIQGMSLEIAGWSWIRQSGAEWRISFRKGFWWFGVI